MSFSINATQATEAAILQPPIRELYIRPLDIRAGKADDNAQKVYAIIQRIVSDNINLCFEIPNDPVNFFDGENSLRNFDVIIMKANSLITENTKEFEENCYYLKRIVVKRGALIFCKNQIHGLILSRELLRDVIRNLRGYTYGEHEDCIKTAIRRWPGVRRRTDSFNRSAYISHFITPLTKIEKDLILCFIHPLDSFIYAAEKAITRWGG